MQRYETQKTTYDCGVTAIKNAGIFLKTLLSRKQEKDIYNRYKVGEYSPVFNSSRGLYQGELDAILRQLYPGHITKVRNSTMDRVDKELTNGNALIVNLGWKQGSIWENHYCFVYDMDGDGYLVANYVDGTTTKLTRKQFQQDMLPGLIWPIVWVIRGKR